MAYVSTASALLDRTVAAGRRIVGSLDPPLAAALVLGAFAMVEVKLRSAEGDPDVNIALLLGLGTTTPVAFARGHPLAAMVATAVAVLVTLVSGQLVTTAGVAALAITAHLVGLRRSRRIAVLVIVPFLAYAIAAPLGRDHGRTLALVLFAVVLVAVLAGAARQSRADAAERDASRRVIADTLLDHAARGERARIARELHDVVAHHISMIAVQAETARLTTPGMPAEGATRLAAIGDTARAALTEMRRLLGVLREDAGADMSRAPQPGLEQLNGLIDEARESAGASTRLIVRGTVVPLDPGVQLTAYRIVQEALTNARRHAPGAAVDVELDYTGDALHVRVRDNGPGPPAVDNGTGHGLLGMRERVGMVGGTLRTGSARIGGFQVEARLPTLGAS